MENGTNRALAYQIATTLSDLDLDNVSGGQAGGSTRQTVRPSAANGQSWDAMYDVVRDFDF